MTKPAESFVAKIRSQNGSPLLGTLITIPSITITQLSAQTAADFAMIDMGECHFQLGA